MTHGSLPPTGETRRQRRAREADERRTARKGVPFGRVALVGYDEDTDRVTYRHFTRGVVVRRLTQPLMAALITPT